MIESLVAVFAAACIALSILDRPGRRRSIAMLLALALAPALIAGDQWQAAQAVELRNSPVLLLAALAGAAVAVVTLAFLLDRWPVLLPVLILVALPFRIPLAVGGENANLLLPLYLVLASGVLAAAYRQWRPHPASAGLGPRDAPSGIASWMKPLLAASVLLYAVGLLYSDDQSQGLLNFCFFLVPFALVFVLMLDVDWNSRVLRIALYTVVGLALVWALVGFVEYQLRELLWNEVVIRSNDFHVYFRVNSLFWDPNVYGRYLALVITVVAAALLWARQSRDAIMLALVSGVLWLALITTFSQSSFIALLAGLATLVALRWSAKLVLGGIGALAVLTLALAVFAGGLVKLDLDRLNPQTAGRADLVSGGIELFGDRPLVGYGPGSFSVSFREQVSGPNAPVTESHTEPITVAAEQGLVGLTVYLGLVLSGLLVLGSGMHTSMPGFAGGRSRREKEGGEADPVRGPPAARAAVLAAFIAALVHTLTYAGFLDDPVTWVLLAIGYSLAFPCRATSAA
ncbi:MAG: O-antigen ligase family protein [Solirubrobacterales bacterium]